MHSKVFAILVMAGALAGSAGAQQAGCGQEPTPVVISNTHRVLRVIADGFPVDSAQVIDLINKGSRLGMTSKDGTISLAGIKSQNDSAVVAVRKIGFDEARFAVTVGCGDTAQVVQNMTRTAEALPAVVSTEKYRLDLDPGKWEGFNQRCSVAHVSCYKAAELAAHPSSSILDVIREADGIRSICNGSGTNSYKEPGKEVDNSLPSCIPLMVGSCYPSYYVDGFRRLPSVPGNPSLTYGEIERYIGPAQIKGIEIYLPEINPIHFGGGAGLCGSVVIWTK